MVAPTGVVPVNAPPLFNPSLWQREIAELFKEAARGKSGPVFYDEVPDEWTQFSKVVQWGLWH